MPMDLSFLKIGILLFAGFPLIKAVGNLIPQTKSKTIQSIIEILTCCHSLF